MQEKVVYWERQNYTETGFYLVEVFENGQMRKRRFEHRGGDYHFFEEKSNESIQLEGKIRIEKITFGPDFCLRKVDIVKNLDIVETYDVSEWQKARKTIRSLQKKSKADLEIDYHSVLVLDKKFIKDNLKKTEHHIFPIVIFRAINDEDDCVHRKENPEQVATTYIPSLNEVLYFHHAPDSRHISMTGDNLFALETKVTDATLDDDEFIAYVQRMRDKVEQKQDYYRKLIDSQRERRAMVDTEIIGDLYPR